MGDDVAAAFKVAFEGFQADLIAPKLGFSLRAYVYCHSQGIKSRLTSRSFIDRQN
jgi:hypothetical protein